MTAQARIPTGVTTGEGGSKVRQAPGEVPRPSVHTPANSKGGGLRRGTLDFTGLPIQEGAPGRPLRPPFLVKSR